MKTRPTTTLFMLMSVDGKISTGYVDERDTDKDFHKMKGIKEGLQQYYDIEKTTDIFSWNSGKVMAKIGANTRKTPPPKLPCTFVIVDNRPHLKTSGVKYILNWTKRLIIVTTNKKHPAFKIKDDNLKIIYYPQKIDFKMLFKKLHKDFDSKRMTIQSGGDLNSTLLRAGLIDRIKIVVSPCLVGGKETPTLIDGKSIKTVKELKFIKSLKINKVKRLKNNYLLLEYKVNN
jgi:2,5-diamino-6-(ribosylamino)-4(3H)-pyrimidinone 5'-phosphate reductase